MKNDVLGCRGFECPGAGAFRRWRTLRREYWNRRGPANRSSRSLLEGCEESSEVTTERIIPFVEPADQDGEDIEEFPLLLQTADVSALIKIAARQGHCAASLARRVIHDYLLQVAVSSANQTDDPPMELFR